MTAKSTQQCPECFGSAQCPACEFADSCRLIVRTEPDMEKPLPSSQNFDEVSEWAPDLADYSNIPGNEEPDDADYAAISRKALSSLLTYLLHLDDYTLGVLAEIVGPDRDGRLTAAQLARTRGCSRQRMHLKLIELADRYPELRPILKLSLLKLRKSRGDFSAIRRTSHLVTIIQAELFE